MLLLLLPLLFHLASVDSSAVARAAADTGAPKWHASVTAGGERFAADQAQWERWLYFQATARRTLDHGSVQLETQRTQRFGLWDQSYVADVYQSLGRRTYANVRILATPDAKILPRADVSATLYQALADGWEVSAGGRRMDFASGDATVVTVGAARSFDIWYARVRASALTTRGGGSSIDGMVRRSPGEDQLFEAGANVGRDVVSINAGGAIDVRPSSGGYARAQRYFGRTWGGALQAGFAAARGIPTRNSAQLTLLARW